MLTILRVIDQHRLPTSVSSTVPIRQTINIDAFKIIYVCVTLGHVVWLLKFIISSAPQ